MRNEFLITVCSIIVGIVGTILVSFISINIVGNGFENPVCAILFVIVGIIISWITYRSIFGMLFINLREKYPDGVVEWAYNKGFLKSVEETLDKLSFSQKKAALKNEKDIKINELLVREEYNKIAFHNKLGLEAFVKQTKMIKRHFVIHHKEDIVRLDEKENKRVQHEKLNQDFEVIRTQYPLGISVWMKNNLIGSTISYEQIEKAQEEISLIAQFEEQEKKRIAKIEAKERKKKELVSWKSEQSHFTNYCRTLRDDFLGEFGSYCYDIDISINGIHSNEKYPVWQMFAQSYCLESDLDYTNFQLKRDLAIMMNQGVFPVYDKLFEDISNYINHINAEEPISLYFCPPADESLSQKYGKIYIRFTEYLDDKIKHEQLYLPSLEDLFVSFDKWAKNINRRMIIVDVCTPNERLMEICKKISSKFVRKRPLINFISIYKGYDREEMMRLIETDNINREKEETKKRKEDEAHHKLIKSVSSWNYLWDGFRYTYLFYYYPTTCEFEANEEEWNNRYIIWNFKNDPEKGISDEEHEEAIKIVLPQIKQRLVDTFSEESLQYLTWACLPASTKDKNEARYKDFSERLCAVTGMENGYEHIHILEDGLSKNNPNNTTGRSIQPEVAFDDWFKSKYVLLFDDVITKGGTMLRYKHMLEDCGAIVVGGLCLGKTKHKTTNTLPLLYNDIEDVEIEPTGA